MKDDIFKIQKCRTCKKEFIHNPRSVYKIKIGNSRTRWYCCYTCWRKAGGGGSSEIDPKIQAELKGRVYKG